MSMFKIRVVYIKIVTSALSRDVTYELAMESSVIHKKKVIYHAAEDRDSSLHSKSPHMLGGFNFEVQPHVDAIVAAS